MVRRQRVYLDTNVLAHWLLYHNAKPEQINLAPRRVRSSLLLLTQIKNGFFNCPFETSDFAFAELHQVIIDNILANKMLRDGQALTYFPSLRNQYELTHEELDDADAYLDLFYDLLEEIKVKAYVITLDMEEIIHLMRRFKLSTSDSIHMAWADWDYRYFVTCDTDLLALANRFKRPRIVRPSSLHTFRLLRKRR